MALSAQNQSTSYVNLYYSIVQRAATRYFKEYYNSGEYRIRTHARMHARVPQIHATHTHTHARTRTRMRTRMRIVVYVKKKRTRHASATTDSPASADSARPALASFRHPPSSSSSLPLVSSRRILSLMSVTGRAGSHLCVHVFGKTRRHRVRRIVHTRFRIFPPTLPFLISLAFGGARLSASHRKPDSNSGDNFDRLAQLDGDANERDNFYFHLCTR